MTKEDVDAFQKGASHAVGFAKFSLKLFADVVLKNKAYVDWITSDVYTHKTYYMGLVDAQKRVNFYDGKLRVVDPNGRETALFPVPEYLD